MKEKIKKNENLVKEKARKKDKMLSKKEKLVWKKLIKEAQRKEKEAYQAQKITFDQEWLVAALKAIGNKLHAMLKSPISFNRRGHETPFCGTTPFICKYNI